jgi:hypothetical protein
MNPLEIELHDARLISVATDYVTRDVTIAIEYYPTAGTQKRKPAQIRFTEVTQLNEVSDLLELQSHASAGNISHWVPALCAGTTFIHLAQGLIAITASSLVFAGEA